MRTVSQQGLQGAARAAGMQRAQIPAALTALATISPQDLQGLAAWGNDPANDWADVAAWKAAFPAVLGSLDDATAAFVIALVVQRAGGTAV